MGHIIAQPGKFSGRAFVIVLSLEFVFLVFLPWRKRGFALNGLNVNGKQHVFTVFLTKWRFWISVDVWVGVALGQNGSFTEVVG